MAVSNARISSAQNLLTVTTKTGVKRNGNLLYTVSPFQDVLEAHYQRQLERLALETARAQLQLGA